MNQKQKWPCADCVDGHCTMNCGPNIPPEVRSAFLHGADKAKLAPTMTPIGSGPRPLRVRGVGRVADEPRAIMVMLTDIPTDDEMRDIHEYVRRAVERIEI